MGSTKNVSAFEAMLLSFVPCFTAPTHETFAAVAVGWMLCLGRRTVVRVMASAGELARKPLSTYHRFFRTARWSIDDLWRICVTRILVPLLVRHGRIAVAGDDTTCGKTWRTGNSAFVMFVLLAISLNLLRTAARDWTDQTPMTLRSMAVEYTIT